MNCRCETVKMVVPLGNRRVLDPRRTLMGTSQGMTPEDALKDGHIRGRSRLSMKHPGYKAFQPVVPI